MTLNTIKASNIEDGTVAGIDFDDNSISSDNIAALSSSKLSGALPALNGSALTGLTAANLTGVLPAISGAALTNLTAANLTGSFPAISGAALTGIPTNFIAIENQQARLALHIGAVEQLAKYNMIDQVIDDYEDTTGIVAFNGVDAQDAVTAVAGEVADHSTTGHTITKYGAVSTSTSVKKFGTASVHCTGSQNNTAHLHVASSSDWNFGTNNFTIEFWGKFTQSSSVANIPVFTWGHPTVTGGTVSTLWYFDYTVGLPINIKDNAGGWIAQTNSTGAQNASNFEHFALVRNGNTWTHYRNGSSTYSTTNSAGHVNANNGLTIIGENTGSTSWAMAGYFDDIRISDIARYTSAFSLPTSAFTNDSNTLFLLNGEAIAAQDAVDAVPNTGSSESATRAGSAGAYYYHGANSNQTLLSTTTTAETAPTKASIILQTEDAAGTVTVNTDLKAYVSRNGGTGWDQATLVKIGTWGNGNVYAADDVAFSNSASGTDMRYKIETLNQSGSKVTRIHGTSLAWV